MLNYFNDWWFWFYGFICFLIGAVVTVRYFYFRCIAAPGNPESSLTATAVIWVLYGANNKSNA